MTSIFIRRKLQKQKEKSYKIWQVVSNNIQINLLGIAFVKDKLKVTSNFNPPLKTEEYPLGHLNNAVTPCWELEIGTHIDPNDNWIFYTGSRNDLTSSTPLKQVNDKTFAILNGKINYKDIKTGIRSICKIYNYPSTKLSGGNIKKIADYIVENYDNKRKKISYKQKRKLYSNEVVYVLKIKNDNLYKIGMTTKGISQRIKQLKTKIPYELEINHVIPSNNINRLEKWLHNKFECQRTKGEWFRLNKDDIEFIQNINCMYYDD